MKLYTCGQKGNGPAAMHPCAKAVNALKDAGHDFEIETAPGYKLLFWTRMGNARDEIKRISGQTDVPVLVLDDGEVINGSGTIARWAKEHPAG
ncbi:MAG: glutathione S-transferase N-terminal domain-containing protein [Solirubrobacteraceae bacterium]